MPPTQPLQQPQYQPPQYNTPTNIIEKQGEMYRGMARAGNKSLWLRVLIVVFSVILFLIPGCILIFMVALSLWDIGMGIVIDKSYLFGLIHPTIFGLIFLYCGIMISYRNIKGIN